MHLKVLPSWSRSSGRTIVRRRSTHCVSERARKDKSKEKPPPTSNMVKVNLTAEVTVLDLPPFSGASTITSVNKWVRDVLGLLTLGNGKRVKGGYGIGLPNTNNAWQPTGLRWYKILQQWYRLLCDTSSKVSLVRESYVCHVPWCSGTHTSPNSIPLMETVSLP